MKIEEAIKGIEILRAQLGSFEKLLHKINRGEPKKVKKWVNIYRKRGGSKSQVEGWMIDTKEGADRVATPGRIACLEIEVEE